MAGARSPPFHAAPDCLLLKRAVALFHAPLGSVGCRAVGGAPIPDRRERAAYTEERGALAVVAPAASRQSAPGHGHRLDRKSTRLNSSHMSISYAVFCLKKKKI